MIRWFSWCFVFYSLLLLTCSFVLIFKNRIFKSFFFGGAEGGVRFPALTIKKFRLDLPEILGALIDLIFPLHFFRFPFYFTLFLLQHLYYVHCYYYYYYFLYLFFIFPLTWKFINFSFSIYLNSIIYFVIFFFFNFHYRPYIFFYFLFLKIFFFRLIITFIFAYLFFLTYCLRV